MHFAWATHGLYLATAALEGALLFSFRSKPGVIAKALRVYLLAALACFAVLFPMSLWQCGRAYSIAYMIAAYLTVASELVVLYGVFRDLQGRAVALGSFREWLTITLLVCAFSAGGVILEASYPQTDIVRFWTASDQILAYLRNLTLVAVVIYSALSACTWSRAASLTWLGLALYSLSDFVVSRLNISQAFEFQALLRFLPFSAGLLMFALWRLAVVPPKQQPITADDRQVIATLRQISRLNWQRTSQ